MPVFIENNRYFLFVHVPKTGGTSIEALFRKSGVKAAYIDYGLPGTLNHLRRCSPQHMHREMLQKIFLTERFNGIFMIVRNPYDRFRSEYCMANQRNIDITASAVEAWAEKIFSSYASNPYLLDNHIRPQHEFHIQGSVIYKLEDGFPGITKDLVKRFGIKLADDDIRVLARNNKSGVSSSDVILNAAVKEMINKQYSGDFSQFGYKMIT